MSLIKDIQTDIAKQRDEQKEASQAILEWIEEQNSKPSIGITEQFGETAAQARAGENQWVRDNTTTSQEELAAPETPIYFMNNEIRGRNCPLPA